MAKIFFDSSVEKFISSLEKSTIAKLLRILDLLEKFGHQLSLPHSKNIAVNLFELRIKGRQEVRLLYCFYQNKIIILHGFIKKSNKIPTKEFKQAKAKLKALT